MAPNPKMTRVKVGNMTPITSHDTADQVAVAELWSRFCVNEHYIPLMLDLPQSSWDMLKRASCPRLFGLGKRRFVLVEDLKMWLKETRDHWEPKPSKRPYRVGNGDTG